MCRSSIVVSAVIALTLVACAGKTTKSNGDGECTDNDNCDPGYACVEKNCIRLCRNDTECGAANDCDGGRICIEGLCIPGCRENAPTITGLDADGDSDPGPVDPRGTVTAHHIRTGLTITGQYLERSSVTLVSATDQELDLTVDSVSDAEVVATVSDPAAIAPGAYVMVVTNAAGAAQAEVWVVRGEQGVTGDAGPTGPTGPVPTEAEIQSAVSAMTNLDVPTLAGRAAEDYQDTHTWGRFYEAESSPLSGTVTVGIPDDDDAASGGRARHVIFGDPSGRAYGFQSGNVADDLIAKGPASVEIRLKVLTNTAGNVVANFNCTHMPQGYTSWEPLNSWQLRAADFTAPDTWQTFSMLCPFLPDDEDQFIGVEYTTAVTDLWIDYVRVTPAPSSGRYPRAPNLPAFAAYDNTGGGNQSTTGIFPGNATYFNNGGHYNTSTYEFVAPVDGFYFFAWSCYSSSSTGRVFLRKNGSNYVQTESNAKGLSAVMELAAGDTVSLGGAGSYPMTWYASGAHNLFSGYLIAAR